MTDEREQPNEIVAALGKPSEVIRNIHAAQRPFAFLCWLLLGILVVWDVYLAIDAVEDNTWSEVTRGASARFPALPWVLGAMVSHLFHHRDDLQPIIDADAASTLMGSVTVALIVVGFLDLDLPWPMGVTALAGLVAGYFLWPKTRAQVWKW